MRAVGGGGEGLANLPRTRYTMARFQCDVEARTIMARRNELRFRQIHLDFPLTISLIGGIDTNTMLWYGSVMKKFASWV